MRKGFMMIGLVCLGIFAVAQDSPNYRQSRWGDSRAAVEKVEQKKPGHTMKSGEGLDLIAYQGKAGSLDCIYGFSFSEDKLVQGRYLFTGSHVNKNQFIEDFESVDQSLVEKYGQPKSNKKVWSNDLYKDDPDDWGMAISAGHLIYESSWQTGDTEILHQLRGDNFECKHAVQYTSTIKEHQDLIKAAEDKAKKGIW